MSNNKQQTEINAVEYLGKVKQFARENNLDKPKQQTAVGWLIEQLQKTRDWQRVINEANESGTSTRDVIAEAKEMEKERTIGLAQQVLFDFLELEGNDRTHLAIKIWACDKLIEIYGGDK